MENSNNSGGLSRRRFLRNSAAIAAGMTVIPMWPWEAPWDEKLPVTN
ncbi:twin-arginine translocation signal domain-containing protein [Marinilabilia salmonicolor]|nr:twin-arginine translocation signal domain-containing protein [Marinilabilia salmonicolor]